jgi:hypothetical protein
MRHDEEDLPSCLLMNFTALPGFRVNSAASSAHETHNGGAGADSLVCCFADCRVGRPLAFFTPCGLGNPRYGRFGNLRYGDEAGFLAIGQA